jgi:hypothetical protein
VGTGGTTWNKHMPKGSRWKAEQVAGTSQLQKYPLTCPISAKRRDSLMFVADLSYLERKRVGRGYRCCYVISIQQALLV